MAYRIKPYLTVLKNLNFTKLWISQVCSQISNYLLSFAILIKVFSLTGSSLAVSAVIVSFGLATLFFGFLAGVYADRFDRKWLLTATNFLQAIAVIFYVLVDRSLFNIAVITFIYSSLNQFYLPAEAPSIPNLVPKSEILIANSYFSFTASSSLIIGFALAGPIQVKFGPNAPFYTTAALLLLASLATLMLPKLKPENVAKAPHTLANLWREFMEGVRHFWNTKALHFPLRSLLAIQVINGMLITIAPAFIQQALGIVLEKGAFLVIAPLGFGILVGALMLGYESQFLSKHSIIISGFLGMGAMILALSLVGQLQHKLFFYSIIAGFAGVFNAHIFAPSHSIIQAAAMDHVRGRVYGALYVMLQLAATLPTVIVGVMADRFSTVTVMVGIGTLLLIYGLFSFSKTKLLDKVLD